MVDAQDAAAFGFECQAGVSVVVADGVAGVLFALDGATEGVDDDEFCLDESGDVADLFGAVGGVERV